jgi:hypothetical protein
MRSRRAATGLVVGAGAAAAVSGVIAAIKPVLDSRTPTGLSRGRRLPRPRYRPQRVSVPPRPGVASSPPRSAPRSRSRSSVC